LWKELVHQAQGTDQESFSVSLPTISDIIEGISANNSAFIMHVIDTITVSDLPARIRIDLHKEKYSVNVPRVYKTGNTTTCHYHHVTLLGTALLKGNLQLFDYLEKKEFPIVAASYSNPLLLFIEREVHIDIFERFYLSYPHLLTCGDKEGWITLNEQNEFIHKYNPLFCICRESQAYIVSFLVKSGMPLHNPGGSLTSYHRGWPFLYYACTSHLVECIQHILSASTLEDIQDTAPKCIQKVLESSDHRTAEVLKVSRHQVNSLKVISSFVTNSVSSGSLI
jgi:hypothetical protein